MRRVDLLVSLALFAGCHSSESSAPAPAPLCVRAAATDDVVRVTAPHALERLLGDLDRSTVPPKPTASLTDTKFDVRGADIGHPVLHQGRMFFFFCDVLNHTNTPDPLRPLNVDVVAWTDGWAGSQTPSTEPLVLQTYTAPDGKYLPLLVDGQPLLGDDGPTSAFSDDVNLYAFFNEGNAAPPKHTLLAVSRDSGRTFQKVADLPLSMVFIANAIVTGADVPGFPGIAPTDRVLVILGRANGAPIAAAVPLATASDLSTWRYDSECANDGGLASVSALRWSADPADAQPLLTMPEGASCGGNFGLGFVPGLDRWILSMRCFAPLGASFFTAPTPFGPWSSMQTLLDPVRDGAFCTFIHRGCDPSVTDAGAADFCCDQTEDGLWGTDDTWGAAHGGFVYGPQVIPGFSTFDATTGVATVDFLVSSGNPYTVYRTRAEFRRTP